MSIEDRAKAFARKHPRTCHQYPSPELCAILVEFANAETERLRKALEFFGIEITEDGGYKFKPASMDKYRKAQNDSEVATLRQQVEILTAMGEHYADKDNWVIADERGRGDSNLYVGNNKRCSDGFNIAQTTLDVAKALT